MGTQEFLRDAFTTAERLGIELTCEYCGIEVDAEIQPTNDLRATADHRTPLSRGGTNRRENLAVCCYYCNGQKGSLTDIEFRLLRNDPKRLKAEWLRWQQELDPQCVADPVERRRIQATKAERRSENRQLMRAGARPDCPACGGTGKPRGIKGDVLCHCCLHPEHIKGKKTPKLWQLLDPAGVLGAGSAFDQSR